MNRSLCVNENTAITFDSVSNVPVYFFENSQRVYCFGIEDIEYILSEKKNPFTNQSIPETCLKEMEEWLEKQPKSKPEILPKNEQNITKLIRNLEQIDPYLTSNIPFILKKLEISSFLQNIVKMSVDYDSFENLIETLGNVSVLEENRYRVYSLFKNLQEFISGSYTNLNDFRRDFDTIFGTRIVFTTRHSLCAFRNILWTINESGITYCFDLNTLDSVIESSQNIYTNTELTENQKVSILQIFIQNPKLIFKAIENGKIHLVQFIVEKTNNPNLRNEDSETILFVACQYNQPGVVRLLLEKFANPDLKENEYGLFPLFMAAQNQDLNIVRLLLKHKANPNLTDNSNTTSLFIASQLGAVRIVHLLLKHSADPNIVESECGLFPLFVASQNKFLQIVGLLLKKEANPNYQNQRGVTSLFIASQLGYKNIVSTLLKYGADPNIKTYKGILPLQIAKQNGHKQVVNLIKKHLIRTKF